MKDHDGTWALRGHQLHGLDVVLGGNCKDKSGKDSWRRPPRGHGKHEEMMVCQQSSHNPLNEYLLVLK